MKGDLEAACRVKARRDVDEHQKDIETTVEAVKEELVVKARNYLVFSLERFPDEINFNADIVKGMSNRLKLKEDLEAACRVKARRDVDEHQSDFETTVEALKEEFVVKARNYLVFLLERFLGDISFNADIVKGMSKPLKLKGDLEAACRVKARQDVDDHQSDFVTTGEALKEQFVVKARNYLVFLLERFLGDISFIADKGMSSFDRVVFLTVPSNQAAHCFSALYYSFSLQDWMVITPEVEARDEYLDFLIYSVTSIKIFGMPEKFSPM